MIQKLLKLIPIKMLVKRLPDVLAFILTRVFTYVLKRYPSKSKVALELANDITKAITYTVGAAEDGVVTKTEVREATERWKEVFR